VRQFSGSCEPGNLDLDLAQKHTVLPHLKSALNTSLLNVFKRYIRIGASVAPALGNVRADFDVLQIFVSNVERD